MNLVMTLCLVQALPLLCPRGQVREGGVCANCTAGQYRDSVWHADPCVPCPPGTGSGPGSARCVVVPPAVPSNATDDSWTVAGYSAGGASAVVGLAYYSTST